MKSNYRRPSGGPLEALPPHLMTSPNLFDVNTQDGELVSSESVLESHASIWGFETFKVRIYGKSGFIFDNT